MRIPAIALLPALVSFASAGIRLTNKGRDVGITSETLADFKFYAQYAAAAYCNSNATAGSTITCSKDACPDVTSANTTVISSFVGSVTDVDLFVASDPTNELVVVSFQGSHSIRDWILDLSFLFAYAGDIVNNGWIHSGFLAQFNEAKEAVLQAVNQTMTANPTYSLIITGHSLGGAVGTITAAYLREQGYPCDLWTYGSPRAGNDAFADFVTNQDGGEYRATHVDDPMPRLPPIWAGYRHTSPEYWFHTGNATNLNYTTSDVEVCAGNANVDCNAGQTGFDTEAHGWYFVDISGCGADETVWKRETDGVSDVELEAKLTAWAIRDIVYVRSGNSTLQGFNVTTSSK